MKLVDLPSDLMPFFLNPQCLQLVVGFFSFLILLCCEARTAALRAALVPVHATFGLITFLMAIATCLTGITEKAINSLGLVQTIYSLAFFSIRHQSYSPQELPTQGLIDHTFNHSF